MASSKAYLDYILEQLKGLDNISYLENVAYEIPYAGAKAMLLVDNVDNSDYIKGLLEAMYDELPKTRRRKNG